MNNIVEFKGAEKKATPHKKIIIIILLFISICFLCYYIMSRSNAVKEDNIAPITSTFVVSESIKNEIPINSEQKNMFYNYGDGFLSVTAQELIFFDHLGYKQQVFSLNMIDPIVSVSESFLAVADKNSSQLFIFQSEKLKYKTKLENKILGITVNRNGDFAVIGDDAYYQNKLAVYNIRGEELFTWLSADGFVMDVSLSRTGDKICASVLDTKNGYFSKLFFFDIFKTEQIIDLSFQDELIVSTSFLDKGTVLVLFDNKIKVLKVTGEAVYEYNFVKDDLKTYDYDGGNLALAYEDGANSYIELIDLSSKDKKVVNLPLAGSVSGLDVHNSTIAISSDSKIYILDMQANIMLSSSALGSNSENVVLLDDNSKLLLIKKTSAYVLQLR